MASRFNKRLEMIMHGSCRKPLGWIDIPTFSEGIEEADGPFDLSVPWLSKIEMPKDLGFEALSTCELGKIGKCEGANWIKASAKAIGRDVRAVHIFDGAAHWSELAETGRWYAVIAEATVQGCKWFNGHDNGKRFPIPAKAPFFLGEFIGFCEERRIPPEVQRETHRKFNLRVAQGLIVPREKFRKPQVPGERARAEIERGAL